MGQKSADHARYPLFQDGYAFPGCSSTKQGATVDMRQIWKLVAAFWRFCRRKHTATRGSCPLNTRSQKLRGPKMAIWVVVRCDSHLVLVLGGAQMCGPDPPRESLAHPCLSAGCSMTNLHRLRFGYPLWRFRNSISTALGFPKSSISQYVKTMIRPFSRNIMGCRNGQYRSPVNPSPSFPSR